MPFPSHADAAKPPSRLERQRALLYHMLTVTREQRRCLIESDLKGLEETNSSLAALLDTQQALYRSGPDAEEPVDPNLVDELRSLAQELRQESRTNYLLACRGAEFANLSISLLAGAEGPVPSSPEPEAAASAARSQPVDSPA